MIRILLLTVAQSAVFGGWGALINRWIWKESRWSWLECFWMGLGASLCLVQILHLIHPINGAVTVGWIIIGLCGVWGWLVRINESLGKIQVHSTQGQQWGSLTLLLVAAFLIGSHLALRQVPLNNDSGLYHLNVVSWLNEYAVVPGLANLHERLAFHSSYLVWASLLDNGWGDGRSAALLPGVLLMVVVMQCAELFCARGGRAVLPAQLLAVVALAMVVEMTGKLIPELYYDNCVHLCHASLLMLLLQHFGPKLSLQSSLRSDRTLTPNDWTIWLTMAALCCTFKLAGVGILILVFFGGVFWLGSRRTEGATALGREFTSIMVLPSLLVVGLIGHNAIQSGWLFYPVPLLRLPVEWSLPTGMLEQLYHWWIKNWARDANLPPAQVDANGFWGWYPGWLKSFYRTSAYGLLWVGVLAFLAWLFSGAKRPQSGSRGLGFALLGLPAASVALWFFGAPDVRFGGGFLWMWMGVSLALAGAGGVLAARPSTVSTAFFAFFVLYQSRVDPLPTQAFRWWAVPKARSNEVENRVVKNGQSPSLQVWTPAVASEGHVGHSLLPATPYPRDELMMRSPGNLQKGFYLLRDLAPEGISPVQSEATTE